MTKLPEKYGLAGMLDPNGEDDLVVGSLPIDRLLIPKHIDLAGNALYWYDDPLEDYGRDETNDKGALNAFVKIRTPSHILRFARRYGPLGLCKHGRPSMHTDEHGERRWCAPCGWEPIQRWLHYVGLATSCLDFTATMKFDPENIQIAAKHFKRIASNTPKDIPDGKMVPAKGFGKLITTDIINRWLLDAGVSLGLDWRGKEPALVLTGGGVFGALGVQLLSAVTSNTLTVCNGCGVPYLREGRKPQAGRRNFCPACSGSVAARIRQRDKRERDRRKGKALSS